jgi:hypothetical protein
MVDTPRTLAALQTIFADDQANGSITAQDVRDLIVSTLGQSGWAEYQDTQYTTGSPQSLTAGTPAQVLINGGVSQKQEMPFGMTELWDTTSNGVIMPVAGSSMMLSFEATIRRTTGTGEWTADFYIDIGLAGPVELYPRTISHNKTSGDKKVTWTTGVYGLDTWVANLGKIMVRPSVDAQIFGARVIPHLIHRGVGTY